MGFEVRVQDHVAPETTLVTVGGKLGAGNAAPLRLLLEGARSHGAKRILVDVSECDYVNSAALGMLIEQHDAQRSAGGELVLVAVPPRFRELCLMLGITPPWREFSDVVSALEGSRQGPGAAPASN